MREGEQCIRLIQAGHEGQQLQVIIYSHIELAGANAALWLHHAVVLLADQAQAAMTHITKKVVSQWSRLSGNTHACVKKGAPIAELGNLLTCSQIHHH